MFCTQCGKENPDNAQFCEACGRAFPAAPAGDNADKCEADWQQPSEAATSQPAPAASQQPSQAHPAPPAAQPTPATSQQPAPAQPTAPAPQPVSAPLDPRKVAVIAAVALAAIMVAIAAVVVIGRVSFDSSASSDAAAASSAAPTAVSSAAAPSASTQADSGGQNEGSQTTEASAQAEPASTATLDPKKHVKTADFEFDIPDYWVGKVECVERVNSYGYAAVDIVPIGMRDMEGDHCLYRLVTVQGLPVSYPTPGGDIANAKVARVNSANKGVEVFATNWAYIAWDCTARKHGSHRKYVARDVVTCVDLSSGGQLTYDDCAIESDPTCMNWLIAQFDSRVTVL